MKIILSGLVCLLVNVFTCGAQVNMSKGSLNFDIPVFAYSDNLTALSFNTSLAYNSGNGLKVNDLSSCVGTGWDISGIPFISRSVNGLPDDQLEKAGNIFDTTKYPPGYLYNPASVSSGCPVALIKYPIFHDKNQFYDNDNRTMADRELDNFSLSLGHRNCSFVIDKNFQAVMLDDSRLKVEIITEDQRAAKHIRTSIKEFDVTDEYGIRYIFSEVQLYRLFKTRASAYIFTSETNIPLDQDPYVITGWFVSKIIDVKSGRLISFSYNTVPYSYQSWGELKTEYNLAPCVYTTPSLCEALQVNITDPANSSYTIYSNPSGVIKRTEILRKEISSVTLPNNFSLQYYYSTDRRDLHGTSVLNAIRVNDVEQKTIINFTLEHGYIIKNEVRTPANENEEKWARLCLLSVKRTGASGLATENPWRFAYHLGSNATENFVPPYFFQAHDPFGYYNGNYAGVPTDRFLDQSGIPNPDLANWSRVCLFNQPHGYFGGLEIKYNVKANYAKNGLLKSVTNPYGGITEYEYEQNYFFEPTGNSIYSYDHLQNGNMAVGGVHLSRIIKKIGATPADDIITEYNYNDEQGHSTLWGEEPMRFSVRQKSYWQAAEKYFSGNSCGYYYLYPGNTLVTTPVIDNLIRAISFIRYSMAFYNLMYNFKAFTIWAINYVYNYVISIIVTCVGSSPPSKTESHTLVYGSPINDNVIPSQFKQVTIKQRSGNNLQSGYVVYELTSKDDFPMILPNEEASLEHKPRCYDWMYGLPRSIRYYDNNSKIVKSVTNEYELKKNDITASATRSCNCEPYYQESERADQWNTPANFSQFTTNDLLNGGEVALHVDTYNLVSGHSELKTSTEKIYDKNGKAITTITNYKYDPATHLPASTNSIDSKGTFFETKNYYIENYDLNAAPNAVLKQMQADHILNVPVSSETWQTKAGASPEMLSCEFSEFGITPSGVYRPVKKYVLQSERPVGQNIIGSFDPSMPIRDPNLIKPVIETTYDQYFGEALQTKNIRGNKFITTIYGTTDRLPVAEITNANKNEVAYASFEPDGGWYTGNWSNVNVQLLREPSPTGEFCAGLNNASTISSSIPISKNYKLSFWASSPSFQISGNPIPYIVGPAISGWTYYEYHLSPYSPMYVTITGNCKLDELRLHPLNASMVTTTYKQGYGKTSVCDINNRIVYFEYDELGRLIKELDDHHNIIKTYEYHFKN